MENILVEITAEDKKELMLEWFGTEVPAAGTKIQQQNIQLAYLSGAGHNLSWSEVLTVAVEKAGDVSIGVVAAYLYDRLKSRKVSKLKIKGKKTTITLNDIKRALEEKP